MLSLWLLPTARGVWSRLRFSHSTRCEYTETRLSFKVDGHIEAGDVVRLTLGGFTSGGCANANGDNIDNVVLWPPTWAGTWDEGDVASEYASSLLTLSALVTGGDEHTVIVDPINGIRANCGIAANSTKYSLTVPNITGASFVNQSDLVRGACYATDASLNFRPARPKVPAAITFWFTPALELNIDDEIHVRLSGWTSGNADGQTGGNRALVATDVDSGLNSSYVTARWREGCCYVQHEPGFANSTAVLTLTSTLAAGVPFGFGLRNGQLRPQCGLDGTNYHVTVLSSNNATLIPWTNVPANAIGDGCRSLKSCSGHGECDHCLQRCDCDDLYGVDPFCENKQCPKAPSWAPLHGRSAAATECADAGLCDGEHGTCNCFEGFEGPSCSRRSCPGVFDADAACSGHGVCASMRGLATNATYATAWDANRLFGCVCDAFWAGADCSLRTCPLAVDPMSSSNRTTKNATECASRGLCDSGRCLCFAGFTGVACDQVHVLAGAGVREAVVDLNDDAVLGENVVRSGGPYDRFV